MNARTLLEDLRSRDIRLETDGERLLADAPVGAITDDLKGALADLKPEILEHLRPASREEEHVPENGAFVECIHRMSPDECAVCSGYARWLIADEDRLRAGRRNPKPYAGSIGRRTWIAR